MLFGWMIDRSYSGGRLRVLSVVIGEFLSRFVGSWRLRKALVEKAGVEVLCKVGR